MKFICSCYCPKRSELAHLSFRSQNDNFNSRNNKEAKHDLTVALSFIMAYFNF